VLLSTLAHELGHGLAAAVLGGRFEALRMYPDAGGWATGSGPLGRIGVATVAGAGLIGPALAAFCMLAFGRTPRGARMMLGCAGTGLVLVALLVARNPFGFVFILLLAGTLIAVATRSDRLAQMTVVLIAVQLALAVFSRSDYLFTQTAMTSAGPAPSDLTVVGSVLFLPYWFWGILCGALSLALLAAGARRFLRCSATREHAAAEDLTEPTRGARVIS